MTRSTYTLIVSTIILTGTSICYASTASFKSLGNFSSNGIYDRSVSSSDDGSIITGNYYNRNSDDNNVEAFRWSESTGQVGLGDLPGGYFGSLAYDVSADGSTVVGYGHPAYRTSSEAFRWTQSEGMIGLGFLPGGHQSVAEATSADGSVIVGSSRSTLGREAMRWTESEGMVGLGDLPGGSYHSGALNVSADGNVVVGHSNIGFEKTEAFRWTQESGMVGLGDLTGGEFNSASFAASANGDVVVGQSVSDSGREAFRWTQEEGMVGLGDLPGSEFLSWAIDTSSDGSSIVGVASSETDLEVFLWTEGNGMRSLLDILTVDHGLDLTGWSLIWPTNLSSDGNTIVGWGRSPDRSFEIFVATLPEPTTLTVLGLGVPMLIRYRY